ncbi:MAG: hypothetical protein ACLTT1_08005 [[Clostridium] scindens]
MQGTIGFNYIEKRKKGIAKQFLPENGYLAYSIVMLEEHPSWTSEELMEEYEDRYEIAGVLKDESGRILYQGHASFFGQCRQAVPGRSSGEEDDCADAAKQRSDLWLRHSREASAKFKENSMKSTGNTRLDSDLRRRQSLYQPSLIYRQKVPAGNNEKHSAASILEVRLASFAGDCPA